MTPNQFDERHLYKPIFSVEDFQNHAKMHGNFYHVATTHKKKIYKHIEKVEW